MVTKLDGKVAVVTGGADGIGRAIAEAMARAGAEIIVGDINVELGAELARGSGGSIRFVSCDVSQASEVAKLVRAAMEITGRLDVMVNNAGVAIGPMPVYEMSDAQWERQIAVNLSSIFYGCKYALPPMIKQKSGAIVNLASMQAHVGIPGWTAYAGTKGAAIAMTQQLAVEFAPQGIRVNSISPGAINTPMNARIVAEQGEQLLKIWNHMHPLGRIGEPNEVAAAAVFLASDEASFITGVDLKVDGGVTLQTRNVP
jgi:NAD(P)-dependent dehydrogenase (short-subunit alcohol dehydrogenase family)